MHSKLREDAMTQTLEDNRGLLRSVVQKFKRKYNINEPDDELMAEALFCFVKAYDRHEKSKGAFSTILTWKIWWGLRDRYIAEPQRRLPKSSGPGMPRHYRESFSIRRFMRDLSSDGKHVFGLIILEEDLTSAMEQLRSYWESTRIEIAMNEIKEAWQER